MTTPPPLIFFEGDWEAYRDRVFDAFLETLVRRRVSFCGLAVTAPRRPEELGMHASFWHVISQAPDPRNKNEAERIPDFRRCERIRWIAWAIEGADRGEPGIHWWENERKGDLRVVIWAENDDFAVVLAKRRDYFVLKTAYAPIKPHQRTNFERERHAFKASQKG
ncbi:hypothetical protein [Salinarimonas sp.]|uniref:hypothetical protein n=1 Tax=Salinarimonas sp. TaxID=2766526 RepID=UPI0032D95F1E